MRLQLILTWVTSIIENVMFSGFVHGWANIQPVLIQENYFSSHCDANTTSVMCDRQIEMMGLVFTLSTSLGQFSCILTGYVLDKLGIWTTRTLLISTIVVAFALFAVSTPETSYLLLIVFPLINIGGTGLLILNHQLAGMYKGLRGSYSLTCQGACNSSPVVLMMWNRMYYSGIKLKSMVYFYIVSAVLLHLRTFTLTPRSTLPKNFNGHYEYGYKDLSCYVCKKTEVAHLRKTEINMNKKLKNDYTSNNTNFKSSLSKTYFWTNTFGTSMICLFCSFFNSSLEMFLRDVLGNNESLVIDYTRRLGAFACFSLLFAPLNGLLLDYLCRKFKKSSFSSEIATYKALAASFVLSNFYIILMYTCSLIPNAELQHLTFFFSVIGRTTYLGCSTFLLTYAFPTKHYGKLTGITRAIVGLTVALQYPLILLVTRLLDRSVISMNVILLIVSILCLAHPSSLFYYQKKLTRLAKNKIKSISLIENCENIESKISEQLF